MTGGQGSGPYGNPEGQGGAQGQPDPQGWGVPQGQPPYGQSLYGQPLQGQPPYCQPRYGQQPYPGYGPAPSAPTGYGAPRPVERPLTVRAGIGAFVASILLSLASALVSLLN